MAQITLLTGPERRRRWSGEDRARILAAAFAPGAIVADVARQFEVSTSLALQMAGTGVGGSIGRGLCAGCPGTGTAAGIGTAQAENCAFQPISP